MWPEIWVFLKLEFQSVISFFPFTQFRGRVLEDSAARCAPSVFHSTKSAHSSQNRQMPSSLPISTASCWKSYCWEGPESGRLTHPFSTRFTAVEPKSCLSFSDWCRRLHTRADGHFLWSAARPTFVSLLILFFPLWIHSYWFHSCEHLSILLLYSLDKTGWFDLEPFNVPEQEHKSERSLP